MTEISWDPVADSRDLLAQIRVDLREDQATCVRAQRDSSKLLTKEAVRREAWCTWDLLPYESIVTDLVD